MTAGRPYRSESLGLELPLPDGAEVLDRADRGLVMDLADAGDGAARVVVTVEPAEEGATLRELTDRALSAGRVAGEGLIDRQAAHLRSLAADHSLTHDGSGLTVEEWRALDSGRLVTLSAACPTAGYDRRADVFAQLAEGLRLGPPPAGRARSAARFDPDNGMLVAGQATFDALREAAAGGAPAAEAAQELEECGALAQGKPHPSLQRALAPVLAPAVELVVAWGETVANGWADVEHASLLVPLGRDGTLRRFAGFPAALLPGVLAGMLGLGPRPAAADREAFEVAPAELAGALAVQRGIPRAAGGSLPPEAAAALAGLYGHWRVDALWRAGGEREMLEVIDAERGLWLVAPRDQAVTLTPVRAGDVWRHLAGLIPARR